MKKKKARWVGKEVIHLREGHPSEKGFMFEPEEEDEKPLVSSEKWFWFMLGVTSICMLQELVRHMS